MSTDNVVDCRWNSDKMKCIANSGYEYKKTDGMTLKITIRNAIASDAGFYFCEVAGYRPSSFGICSLPMNNDIKGNWIQNISAFLFKHFK